MLPAILSPDQIKRYLGELDTSRRIPQALKQLANMAGNPMLGDNISRAIVEMEQSVASLAFMRDHTLSGGCWIDGRSNNSMHSHHTIPQAYGGKDSPRVMLCNSCHEGIHHAARRKISSLEYSAGADPKSEWCESDDLSSVMRNLVRAHYLIAIIVNSKEITDTSQNKKKKVVLSMSEAERRQMKAQLQ